MVISLNKVFIFSLFCTFGISTCIASPQLVVQTDKTEFELGYPVRTKIYGVSLQSKISELNLERLNSNFGVVIDYVDSKSTDQRWPGKSVQILQLKLYPRKTGDITIPPLQINNIHSKKSVLHITQGNTGEPVIRVSTLSPYNRQQVIINFSVTTGYKNARLTNKIPFGIKDFEIVPLEFSRTVVHGDKYLLHAGWSLTALSPGEKLLTLPPVEYSINGASRKLFYPPEISLKVKKLPPYLPATIPVGKVFIKSELSKKGILGTDSLYYWTLQLSANINSAFSLPPVLRQLKSNTQLTFYPATSGRKTVSTVNTVTSHVTHIIPFKSVKSGPVNLPEIKYQYFDPDSEKLKTLTYATDSGFALSNLWKTILSILLLLIFIYTIKFLVNKWNLQKTKNAKRLYAIQLLQQPANRGNTREAFRLISETETGLLNSTLSQWKEKWSGKYQTNEDFETLYHNISQAFYSDHHNINLSEINSALLRIFRNRKRIKQFKNRII